MNISVLQKIKKKLHKKDKVKIVTEGYRITHHWVILVIIFTVIFFISLGVIFYIYTFYASSESREKIISEQSITTIDRERLQNTIQEFKNKETKFKETLENPPNVVDPSL